MDDEIEQLLQTARAAAIKRATDKSKLEYLEQFRRHLIASLMIAAEKQGVKSVAGQERDALGSDEYHRHLVGLQAAQEAGALSDWWLREAEHRIDLWRTEQASLRLERKAYKA